MGLRVSHEDIVTFSNTLFFERELGWRGLLVEANPTNHATLKHTRTSAHNTLIHAAVCEATGASVSIGGKGVQSGIISSNASHSQHVPCMPLHALIRRAGLRRIDLFSLDVEGYELAALRTMDWSVPVGVFVIETAKLQADEEDNELRALLERHGYAFMQHMGAKRSHALWRHTG